MLPNRQRGLVIIEFTVISLVLMFILLAIFEISRFLFVYQMANEMTRKTARLAAVCDVNTDFSNLAEVKEVFPPSFDSKNLIVQYYNNVGDELKSQDSNTDAIYFVSAKIEGYEYRFIDFFKFVGVGGSIIMPSFATIIPRESLGENSKPCV